MSKKESAISGEQKQALPAPLTKPDAHQIRDQRWAEAARAGELANLTNLPDDENINKADSVFFASLLRIAAITKGTGRPYLSPADSLESIQTACQAHTWLKPKEIERQWKNAYNLANARYKREK